MRTLGGVAVRAKAGATVAAVSPAPRPSLDFDAVYAEQFAFVWRSLRRLGVPERHADDATQDVFLVAHQKLETFTGTSSVKTWLFGITHLMALTYARRHRRKGGLQPLPEGLASQAPSPERQTQASEAGAFLDAFLGTLDDTKRAVFVLAELEQMSAPEIADALAVNVNMVYSRLRAARQAFQQAVNERGRGDA